MRSSEQLQFRHCEFLPFRHCEDRSDEAISSLHIPVGVRCFEEIASPDCYQARNDAIGLFACNDARGVFACNGNFSQVNKEKKLKKNKIINQQKLNAYGN
jgi:hypothetical protein